MKKGWVLIVSVVVFALPGYAQLSSTNPYQKYALTTKIVFELEWRLVQINLRLAEAGYFIYFDGVSNLFRVDKFVDTYTLRTTPPAALRELLVSQCDLVEAVVGAEIPEFRQRGSKDLDIKFLIGEASPRQFATYSLGSFAFTDAYYSFRRELGR